MPRTLPPLRFAWIAIAHLWIASLPGTASACPDCATGRAARASVLDHDFTATLSMIAAPLLVVAVIAAVLHRLDLEP